MKYLLVGFVEEQMSVKLIAEEAKAQGYIAAVNVERANKGELPKITYSPALVSNALYDTPCAANRAFAALTNSHATVLAESAE